MGDLMATTTHSGRRTPAPGPAGVATRLPSGRERRPLLAVLAVLLIVGGAAAAGIVALRLADRTEYAYLGQDVGTGERIEPGYLRKISLTKDEAAVERGVSEPKLMTAEEAGKLLGWYSRGDYPAGTLVNEDMFAEQVEFPANTAEVGLVLTREQVVSRALGINDRIQIFSTSSDVGTAAVKVGEGTIVDVASSPGDTGGAMSSLEQGIHLTVRVPANQLPAVAQAAGNGTAYVAVVAGDTSAGGAG
jgi:hypothetical protein